MAMKKTDLFKNKGLSVANRMKNATKMPKVGVGEKAQVKKELAKANPLLASLMSNGGRAKNKK